MGLIDKIKPKVKEPQGLTKEESEFLLAKLRTAKYYWPEREVG